LEGIVVKVVKYPSQGVWGIIGVGKHLSTLVPIGRHIHIYFHLIGNSLLKTTILGISKANCHKKEKS
jgi:hypothetical protein